MTLANLRTEYLRDALSEETILPDPIDQLSKWLNEAITAKIPEPNAMSLSTVDLAGRLSSRIVLMKDLDYQGITWYTHYTSKKGRALAEHPHAALLFFWPELERQVRIEGSVEKVPTSESDAYFITRPLASQQGALASKQSEPIANRALLEAHFQAVCSTYTEGIPRPAHWGGYRLLPNYIEFWQGRASRLHDRIAYTKGPEDIWSYERLQP